MNKEHEKLILQYFSAFAHLYGIIPLYRALRIIRKQNPELEITEEQFLAVCAREEEWKFYTIAGENEIYENVPETPPMKREIIEDSLYAADDFESYRELKLAQQDKPWYIPDRDILLRYSDTHYFEETKAYRALAAFLGDVLNFKHAEDLAKDLELGAEMGDVKAEYALFEIRRHKFPLDRLSRKQAQRFWQLYADMCNNTRMACNRGHTPNEMMILEGGPAVPAIRA